MHSPSARWVVDPYPTGTCTPQDTPSFAWHNNVFLCGGLARWLQMARRFRPVRTSQMLDVESVGRFMQPPAAIEGARLNP
jgi:hypothetical protein